MDGKPVDQSIVNQSQSSARPIETINLPATTHVYLEKPSSNVQSNEASKSSAEQAVSGAESKAHHVALRSEDERTEAGQGCILCGSNGLAASRSELNQTVSQPEKSGGLESTNSATKSSTPRVPPTGLYIEYHVHYTNSQYTTDVLYSESDYEPITNRNDQTEQRRPVFDVIKKYRSIEVVFTAPSERNFTAPPAHYPHPDTSITVRSPILMEALRTVVKGYPDTDLSVSVLEIKEPYAMLVHYYDDLRVYRNSLKDSIEQTHADDDNGAKDSYKHIDKLLEFLDEQVMESVNAERKRHSRGYASFNMLWLLFKPQMEVAIFNRTPKERGGLEMRDGGILVKMTGGQQQLGQRQSWLLNTWSLEYDGSVIHRRPWSIKIRPFDGEILISSLDIFPMDDALRQKLEVKGKKWYSLLKPVCMQHRGEVLTFPFHQMEGQVMVDIATFIEFYPDDPLGARWKIEDKHDEDVERYGGPPPVEELPPGEWSDIRRDTTPELSKEQYALCPQSIAAYFFKTRQWEFVDVDNLEEAHFDERMMDTLVLDDKRRHLLISLAQSFVRPKTIGNVPTREYWTADFLKGKGKSQIFLLHGQPGVGKTYTAECIAESTRRPLMTLTCSDIGTRPEDIEQILEDRFKLAKRWGAILLIDEADIYLERRSQSDLTRNSLVAGFLRVLEIYDGILFLTSNRVGEFDDAFISRIHVPLFYPPLSPEHRQKIWNNFMDKLLEERGDRMKITEEVREFIAESPAISKLKLNGREIRNIFQTAVGLAEFEGKADENGRISLKRDHVRQVAEMTGEFKEYIDKAAGADEETRAYRAFARALADTKSTW